MRLPVCLLALAVPALTACVEGGGFQTAGGPSSGRSITEQCAIRTARAVGMKTDALLVQQSLSYPEGDLVVIEVPGQGKIRCTADINGALGDLIWIQGGPAKPAAAATPAAKAS